MASILSIGTMVSIAAKRLLAQRVLALAVTLGLVVLVALAVSLPIYADAINHRILEQELGTLQGTDGRVSFRAPFAFMFRYVGNWYKPLDWADVAAVDDYLRGPAGSELGLPRKFVIRHLATDKLDLFPRDAVAYADTSKPLDRLTLGVISDLADHVVLTEGRFPAAGPAASDTPVEVLLSEALVTRLGLQVGETYLLLDSDLKLDPKAAVQIPIRVAGVWRPINSRDEFWFYEPVVLESLAVVPEASFLGRIGAIGRSEVNIAVWYLVMDGSNLTAENAEALLGRIVSVQQRASGLLPNVKLEVSPAQALGAYRERTFTLSVLLDVFSVPVIALVLAFIALVAGLLVQRQRNEMAMFRSRGATLAQVLGITFFEGLMLGAVGLAAGLPAGRALAALIGQTRTFLDFSLRPDLRLVITDAALRLGILALGLALVAQLAPVLGAARHTIVTYKQDRARALRPPWWQRAWLDVLLLIPAAYGAYLLRRQGSLFLPGTSGQLTNDPFQNPLLFLVPALGLYAMTLILLRLLPPAMAALSWLAGQTNSIAILLTTRYLSRTQSAYTAPLALLILTVSLSAYTASLAQTLDRHASDHAYYQVGADMRLVELGATRGESGANGAAAFGDDTGGPWDYLPVTEHLRMPGVQTAARVARYPATTQLSSGQQVGWFLGVDRVDFSRTAFWRPDFAAASLGALMNALAVTRNAVLLPRDFMGRHALNVGDRLRVTVQTPLRQMEVDFRIAGDFVLFPTWYPATGPLFVGNLDYLFELVGNQMAYDVWLKTDPAQEPRQIAAGLRELGFNVVEWEAPSVMVRKEETRPERQGLFGLLSIGFGAAALFSVLGFMLYALFSFRRRFIELGVLRAIGLSVSQMTLLLASELGLLILVGMIAGTLLGSLASELFIPYLQIGTGPSALVPPYMVVFPQTTLMRIYALLGLLFVITLSWLAALLLRMRIFQAIKLGETT